jgi:hypothetical protein
MFWGVGSLRRATTRATTAVVVLAMLVASPMARADEPLVETARRHFRAGEEPYRAGAYECAKLSRNSGRGDSA